MVVAQGSWKQGNDGKEDGLCGMYAAPKLAM